MSLSFESILNLLKIGQASCLTFAFISKARCLGYFLNIFLKCPMFHYEISFLRFFSNVKTFNVSSILIDPVPHEGVRSIRDRSRSADILLDKRSVPLSNRILRESIFSSFMESVVGTIPHARYPPSLRNPLNSSGYIEIVSIYP